ncbi:ComEC/Rec2 family competence protein [Dyadobacter fermentans]|uniref:Beta-lactamase domain protein n=1 Tax=Dyadobacter fermentans (strain ATCC 700827 / DSM 18053 / CIP 107007 / KCTC 52180 / NS114) TaxID=471854 RepID=C6W0U6_DYAFD|nr:MBL fold metallo-hydrolase [Dyadobacter fermentans]ACT95401.1 beta-lactamase domain protein [Dyadobacter fermentans DSM 18053]
MKENLPKTKKTQIHVLPAYHGDCLIVRTFDHEGNDFNILIDGGTAKTFNAPLKSILKNLSFIDIVILTHIDSDHIGGLIKFVKSDSFNPDKIGQYWFNSKNIKFISAGENISYEQAKTFEELLIDKGAIKSKWSDDVYIGKTPCLPEGLDIEILSPSNEVLTKLNEHWPEISDDYKDKLQDITISGIKPSQLGRGKLEDLALADDTPEKTILADLGNSSSIAFALRTPDLSILLLGDSHPHLIQQSMKMAGYSTEKKLKVDIVKVSHHGSKNNTTNDVLDMIECDRFIISTNGGNSKHTHPDRETIARIIHHPERTRLKYTPTRKIYLNYPIATVEEKAGKFIGEEDFTTGNWELIASANLLEHE